MAIQTRLTELFALDVPLVLAPMGGVAGGALAAAVANAGALGLVGGGYGDVAWLERELTLAREHARGAWGVGFITWHMSHKALACALGFEPAAVMLSFGDPQPWSGVIKDAGCRLICQVQDRAGALAAVAAGADLIIAQGTEAGGHGGVRSTLPLVPAVSDWVQPIPTLAAGGVVDGRGLAAALMLGAAGALIGTRFFASHEALGGERRKRRIVEARGDETVRTRVFDIVRDYDWPAPFTGRAICNAFVRRWHGREDALRESLPAEREAFARAQAEDDCDVAMVWAGEGVDSITQLAGAGDLVRAITEEAESTLRSAQRFLR